MVVHAHVVLMDSCVNERSWQMQLDGALRRFEQAGGLRVLSQDLNQMDSLCRSFTDAELQQVKLWADESRPVLQLTQDWSRIVWEDASFICLLLPLDLAIVLLRIRSPPIIRCFSAYHALQIVSSGGYYTAISKLLSATPLIFDFMSSSSLRRVGRYDTEALYRACASKLRPQVRFEVVKALIMAYMTRKEQQQHTGAIFSCLDHNPGRPSYEWRALKEMHQRGDDDCFDELIRAGVPACASADAEPEEQVLVQAVLDGHYATVVAEAMEHATSVMDRAAILDAMRLFGGNAPMAFAFLVGSKGLRDRPPPGGWGALDPEGAKAQLVASARETQQRLRDCQSRLLREEVQALRDELLAEQERLEERGAPDGDQLLAFVCNPDQHPNPQASLRMALNDAIAASYGMPATIIGGAVYPNSPAQRTTVEAAVSEDRRATFERLEEELADRSQEARRRPSAFLFSGHAGYGEDKTLGFVTPDGQLAPIVDKDRVANLLSRHAGDSGIKLVLLNGCQSAELARMCHGAGVPVAVGWRTVVQDEASYLFVRGFFRSLGRSSDADGGRYRRAFVEGLDAITSQTRVLASGEAAPYFVVVDPDATGRRKVDESWPSGVPVLFDAEAPAGWVMA